MQGSTGQGNQNGQQKQGGLSWTQSPSTGSAPSNTQQGGMKPLSQTTPSAMPQKGSQQASSNTITKNSSLSSMKKADAKAGTSGAKLTSIFLAGVVVGLIIGWGWFSLGRDDGKVATTNTPTTSSSSETTQGNAQTTGTETGTQPVVASGTSGALTVAPQAAGVKVAVSNISVSVPTWVVIFDGAGGKVGNVLGAQMFFPGQSVGSIELLRATVAGQNYYAGEYVDNGDHIFSKQQDTQVNTVAGSQMLVQFKVQ